jgi:capsular exopolysaccharide synthesis family protein
MDIRKSSVSKHFKHLEDISVAKTGLSEYLLGFSDKPNVVQTTIPGLSVLFAGERCTAPQELITSQKMSDLINSFEAEYDIILIDTPPLIVSDARLISNLVNGYLISTRANYSTLNSIANTEEELKKVGARIFGIVLNEYKPKFRKKDLKYTIYSDYSR